MLRHDRISPARLQLRGDDPALHSGVRFVRLLLLGKGSDTIGMDLS